MRLKEVILIRAKEPVLNMIKRLRKLKETHLVLRRLKKVLPNNKICTTNFKIHTYQIHINLVAD